MSAADRADLSERIRGSILALALGDACGAAYEGGVVERALWSLIGRSGGLMRFTDDTQMTLDLIESLLACGGIDQDDLAARFAGSYAWSRGYGGGTARTLKLIRGGMDWRAASRAVYPEGSLGNGAAMRAPAVGLFFHGLGPDEIANAAGLSAAVTHAHIEGVEGARMVAGAVAAALLSRPDDEIVEGLRKAAGSRGHAERVEKAALWLAAGAKPEPEAVAAQLGNGVLAVESCCTAVYSALAFRSKPFEDLLSFTIGLGGDTDTISAMACAIWGAANGVSPLPKPLLARLEQKERIDSLAMALSSRISGS